VNRHRTARVGLAAMSCALLAGLCGCGLYYRSSLATDTGPVPQGTVWATAKEQWAHVGETLRISYVLPEGIADYAVLRVLPGSFSKVASLAEPGHFYFEVRFDHPTPPDRPYRLVATAYHQRGERDFMDMDGQLLVRQSQDVPDAVVAKAQILLHVYQSRVNLKLPPEPNGYRWETGRLVLYLDGGREVTVRAERYYRRGFKVIGPDRSGAYTVSYEPTADQVNKRGVTRVAFFVVTGSGVERKFESLIPTP